MKIAGINRFSTQNFSVLKQKNTEDSVVRTESKTQTNPLFAPYYMPVSFSGTVKTKKLNIEQESRKLLKQITEHLKIYSDNMNEEDNSFVTMLKFLKRKHEVLEKKKALLEEMQFLIDSEVVPGENLKEIMDVKRIFDSLKIAKKPQKIQIKPIDERIDYELIKHFRAAVESGNFDFQAVYADYYSGLKDIKTIDELAQKYPQIKIPKPPEGVIADKFIAAMTRDFFVTAYQLVESGNRSEFINFISTTLLDLAEKVGQKLKIDPKDLAHRIADASTEKIVKKIEDGAPDFEFKNIRTNIKKTTPAVTQNDINLLFVDFDDYVLSVIRAHYLDSKRLNDITYEHDGLEIKPSSYKEKEYKFERFSEKQKKMISDAQAIFNAQRDYDNFDKNEFMARLEYYAASDVNENEDVCKHIIDFATCSFTEEDIHKLREFLRVLDKISDNKITAEEGAKEISLEGLYLSGTQKLKDDHRLQREKELKQKQKQLQKIKLVQDQFNDAIKILYANNLSDLAQTCLNYMPHNLDDEVVYLSDYIVKIVKDSLDEKGRVVNKFRLDSNIRRFDTYNLHKVVDSESEIFKDACEYARLENGEIDEIKAGQYIINREIVEEYPESAEVFYAPEILAKIFEKSENKVDSIDALCRYDNYYEMDSEPKSSLKNILGLFDERVDVDKAILKYIIESDYLNIDTSGKLEYKSANGGSINVVLASKAKKEIAEKYKFPRMIEYLLAFEEALSAISSSKGNTGVKLTRKNNATIKHKMELKITGNDDRVFSSKNDFYFDTYSETGLH